jgi:hypothetical protein
MMIVFYASKKDLKEAIGQKLKYRETSIFNEEYQSTGRFVASNRPSITGIKTADGKKAKEFFAQITMKDDLIEKVE